jgi:hypothetical protein
VDAAFDRPSLPRFSASLTFSRAAPKSDEREPGLADVPCVDAFTISLRAALPRLLVSQRVSELTIGQSGVARKVPCATEDAPNHRSGFSDLCSIDDWQATPDHVSWAHQMRPIKTKISKITITKPSPPDG